LFEALFGRVIKVSRFLPLVKWIDSRAMNRFRQNVSDLSKPSRSLVKPGTSHHENKPLHQQSLSETALPF
jgi:hypothetical protein